MKVWLIVLLCILLFIIATIIYFIIASEVRYHLILKRNSTAAKIISRYFNNHLNNYGIDLDWWKQQKTETLQIKSFDNLNLVANFLPNKSKKFAIIVHGFGSLCQEMQPYIKMFLDMGYNILAPDNRAHGKSQGKVITMGHLDKLDVYSWIQYLNSTNTNIEIVVFGLSMGAATVCLLNQLSLPENVKALISDCAYSNAYDVMKNIAKRSVIFYILPTMRVFNSYSLLRAGFMPSSIKVDDAVKNAKIPMLFIHGKKDTLVPFDMHSILYNATPSKKKYKYIVKNAGHAESYAKNPDKYIKKIENFLNKIKA